MLNDEWLEKVKKIHKNKYTYPQILDKLNLKIKITCPEHGDFFTNPSQHMLGSGCKQCKNPLKKINRTIKKQSILLGNSKSREFNNEGIISSVENDYFTTTKIFN